MTVLLKSERHWKLQWLFFFNDIMIVYNYHVLQEILKKVPDIYAPNLEESEPANQGTFSTGGFVYRGLLKVSYLPFI